MQCNWKKIGKYALFAVLFGLLLVGRDYVTEQVRYSFQVSMSARYTFFMNFVLGAMLILLTKEVFDRKTWSFNLRVDTLLALVVFLFLGSFLLYPTKMMVDFTSWIGLSVYPLAAYSMLVVGALSMTLFLKDSSGS